MISVVLQRVVYPEKSEQQGDMYVRQAPGAALAIGEDSVSSDSAAIVFDTYFNTFSLKKWKKYTMLQQVRLRIEIHGNARLVLTAISLERAGALSREVVSLEVSNGAPQPVVLDYPPDVRADALGFRVEPLAPGVVVRGGAYETDADGLRDVNLALAICTCRREEYVRKTIATLREAVFDAEDSMLRGHLRVYIADNGRTLDVQALQSADVRIFPNKNTGGSGGFTRAAIEALRDESFHATHVILMDDDISFRACSLERNYAFLRLMKEEYRVSMLGGAMMRTDSTNIQHAAGETMYMRSRVFNKMGCDMNRLEDVLRNEVEEDINYLGWWYCCVPAEVFGRWGFSMPMFVQYDDIEFGLRTKDVPKITLNGVCCWHLPFEKKWSDAKNYYAVRNRAVMDCITFDNYTKLWLRYAMLKESLKRIIQFSYSDAHFALRGIEDFLKGPQWLIAQDPVALNTEVMSAGEKLLPPEELPGVPDPKSIRRKKDVDYNLVRRAFRFATLNGWILPGWRKLVPVETFDPPPQFLYGARSALKWNDDAGKGLVAEKSYRQAFAVFRHLFKVYRLIDRDFDNAVGEYRRLRGWLTSEEFWHNYLGF